MKHEVALLEAHDDRSTDNLVNEARKFEAAALASGTRRAYAACHHRWSAFAGRHGFRVEPAEPGAVALFIAEASRDFSIATIEQTLAYLSILNQDHGRPGPLANAQVKRVWRGLKRSVRVRQSCKAPLLLDDIQEIVERLPQGIVGDRDRAIILLGFASAMRRSELAAANFEDLSETDDGLLISIPKSKTDTYGRGQEVLVSAGRHPKTCPIAAVERWAAHFNPARGAIFRSINRQGIVGHRLSGESIAKVVKRAAAAAGIDPSRIGGHSLRAGFVTQALLSGADERSVMRQTRHSSHKTLERYMRHAALKRSTVGASLGL